ncbi:MAG TPA: PA14 domain-containing protein [Cyclobacteriaceae bacterium]|nr:PA14 domain-containing protein [Cyclobacteriaceae bacterium]
MMRVIHASHFLFVLAFGTLSAFQAEGQTAHYQSGNSLRKNQPGHYYKMVSFDDQQYQEFFYSLTNSSGSVAEFMNWRIVFPPGYNPNASSPYPMIVMLHGAGESGREWSGHFVYDPTDPRYDNNDDNLLWGGKEHLDAVNSSSSSTRAFPGVVVFPQASYSGNWSGDWNDGTLNDNGRMAVGIIEYLIANYNIDQNRISIHGLSGGAKGVWDFVAKRPDLFCAMLPMSGVGSDMNIMTDILVTTPLWLFQGGQDTNPSPGYAQQWIDMLKSKGGNPRYTLYPNLDHGTWNTAYQEPDFFSWMRAQDKRNIYVFGGNTSLDANTSIKLGISAGFLEYQWMLNGAEIQGATSRFYTATQAGSYTVKFRRRTDNLVAQSFTVTLTSSQTPPPPPPPEPGPTNGLSFNYYEYSNNLGGLSSFDFTQPPTLSGNVNNFYPSVSQQPDHFVVAFDGLINVSAGTYRFYTKSQDGSILYINGQQVVNNDGQHQPQVASNTYNFPADGRYPIRVTYFNQQNSSQLLVGYNAGTANDFSVANMLADANLFLPGSKTSTTSGRIAAVKNSPADTLTIKDHEYQVAVFPNPFQQYIHVWFLNDQMGNKPIVIREIYSGRIVKEYDVQVHDNEAVIDCADLPAGLYLLSQGDRHYRMLKKN